MVGGELLHTSIHDNFLVLTNKLYQNLCEVDTWTLIASYVAND